jgi:hypothetical protein
MGRDGRSAPGQFVPPPAGGFPVMPTAFTAFDQNDPMAAMIALQSMGFPQMPGMPPMPIPAPGGSTGQPQDQMAPKSSERCPFWDTQGICYLGAACPYQHDTPGIPKEDGRTSIPVHLLSYAIAVTNQALQNMTRSHPTS